MTCHLICDDLKIIFKDKNTGSIFWPTENLLLIAIISEEDINFLYHNLSQLSKEVLEIQSKGSFQIIEKSDGSPVTSADLFANERIIECLKTLYPDDEIISEEDETHTGQSQERTWFVDPIDGTKNFISGKNPFFFLLGLSVNGKASFGLEFRPYKKSMIYTLNERVYHRNPSQTTQLRLSSGDGQKTMASLTMKGLNPEQRESLIRAGITRHPYFYQHVDMLAPLFEDCIGTLSLRETWFWDLCAPVAIMNTFGYDIEMYFRNECVDFSSPSMKCDYLLSLRKSVQPTLNPEIKRICPSG